MGRRRKTAKDLIKHAAMRCQERFGIEWTEHLRNSVKHQIKMHAPLLEAQSNSRSIFLVELAPGIMARAAYDENRREIRTLMKLESEDE